MADIIGGTLGVLVMAFLMAIFAAGLYLASRRAPVNHDNVNADWEEHGLAPKVKQPAPVGA